MENSSAFYTSKYEADVGAGGSTKSRRSSSRRDSALNPSEGQLGLDLTPVVPSFDTTDSAQMVQLKPDLEATDFSSQNAFFFAKMSKLAYSSREDVELFMTGDGTSKGLGFDHFHWFQKEGSADQAIDAKPYTIQDTQAFIVANDDIILVVFRGTSEISDWTTNLSFSTTKVPPKWGVHGENCAMHQGFADGVNTVWYGKGGMHQTIQNLYVEKGKSRRLFITGHSLGGALATVAAARLAFVDDMNIYGMYTIGSPRVFAGALPAHFDSKLNHGTLLKDKYFRCRNNNDIVPRVVPPPYHHVGTEIYLDRFGAIGITSIWDRILGRLSAYLRMSFIDGVNDHSSSEYIRLFKQLVINSKLSLFNKAKSVAKDVAEKVTHLNAEKAKLQETEINEAKTEALDASKEAYDPTGLTAYDTELHPTRMQGA